MALSEIRGETRHSDRFLPGGIYQTLPLGDAHQRQYEFYSNWRQIMKQHPKFKVGNILEIGPGSGGETKALQSLYPNSQITAIDIDERAELAAEENGIEVISLDLATSKTPERINRLVTRREINTVVALRTSSEVANNLLQWWASSSGNRVLVFSLMWASDAFSLPQIHKQAIERGASQIHLSHSGRLYEETILSLAN